MISVMITVQVEKQKTITDEIFYFNLFMDNESAEFALAPHPSDSIKVRLLIYRLKNLEREAYYCMMEKHQFDESDSSEVNFVKRRILEIELGNFEKKLLDK